jgi:general secretion pathway protein G
MVVFPIHSLVIRHSLNVIFSNCPPLQINIQEFPMSRRLRRRSAFTLMEILLVLAILVVLGSMVSLGYVKIQQEANKKAALTQLNLLEGAVNTYILDVGTPPTDLSGLVQAPPDLANPAKWAGPYLGKEELPVDPWNQPYQFEIVDQANAKFRIWSNGPDQQPGSSDDITTKL